MKVQFAALKHLWFILKHTRKHLLGSLTDALPGWTSNVVMASWGLYRCKHSRLQRPKDPGLLRCRYSRYQMLTDESVYTEAAKLQTWFHNESNKEDQLEKQGVILRIHCNRSQDKPACNLQSVIIRPPSRQTKKRKIWKLHGGEMSSAQV